MATAFLNQVLIIDTLLSPLEILEQIHNIENKLGRKRQSNGYESRIIDIDILFYEDLIISEEDLEIPHPRLHLRKFTLKPLAEIDGGFMHPVLKQDIDTISEKCTDKLRVEKFKEL